ncbi:imelysin family protein [Primorskyibacter flagellatus]|uniref:imelysin family protein n=1 Tax=Primorskyibacter flagellatus TaxID=1387277 RepID=UPI003A9053FD
MRLILALAFAAGPAFAGVPEAVNDHILPMTARFSEAAENLSTSAKNDCTANALQDDFQAAFDAWMGISYLRIGPVEQDGRALAIQFWPDTRGLVPRTVARLIADKDAAAQTTKQFADVSIAGRGFAALERVLFEPEFSAYAPDSYTCTLAQAMSADLAQMADAIAKEWRDEYAQTVTSAGDAGNTTFLTKSEAAQALYTTLTTGIELNADQRLGRPLGTFDRPRPTRAEAYRSGRSLRNVILSLESLHGFAQALADGPTPQIDVGFDIALQTARDLDDPIFAGVADPQGRLQVEILQQKIKALLPAIANEVGVPLGVSAGFNATDGD